MLPPAIIPFRAAIAAAPDAALPRRVFADFLDDRDFPRHAAALRLDTALAAERPWADRYWLLKAERDAHAPADFPGDLGWLSDRQPLLCGVPDDWRSHWRAVRAFVSRQWDVPLGDVGRWGAAVEDAERVVGRELPPSVKEWAAFPTEFEPLPKGRLGGIRDPIGFRRLTEGVALLTQAEGDVCWTVRDDQRGDDPPVETYYGYPADGPLAHGERWSDGVAEFALAYLAAYRSGPNEWEAAVDDATNWLDPLFPARGRFGAVAVYESVEAVALVLSPGQWGHNGHYLRAFAVNPAAVAAIRAATV